ncbi:pyroglutamyl-peptidase I Cysteine peptidase. MEROPS family C15 [Polaromonas sp. YR568]|uniref:pyroglutamyl-peptidase I n=1 Tax=Polaromonas sp. YR568 TaxID=1855301 RepID=UPI0008EC8D2A|nr:pyroglutamyl-peptidase I [Polaromonas sp. YR568]SFU84092.1 pyroglutamyl-peptidase I Cysteine peptidase. MEROPS family C15 [Polaromonas sp. YR568]
MPASPSTPTAPSSPALPCVLLTGFDPFGDLGPAGLTLNPSWMAVKALQGKRIAGHRIVAAQLPTVFGDSALELKRLLKLHKPALVICVGQAGGRNAISLERVAINVNDARIPDNTGSQPIDTPVVADGPAAYFGTLPIKAMLQAMQAAGIRSEVSQTAGTFVCNHVFYALIHALTTQRGFKRTRGGFIHVPYVPEQVAGQNVPSMPLEEIVNGLRVAVATALATGHDISKGAGAVS